MFALKIVLIIVSVLDLFSQNGNKSKSHKFNYHEPAKKTPLMY